MQLDNEIDSYNANGPAPDVTSAFQTVWAAKDAAASSGPSRRQAASFPDNAATGARDASRLEDERSQTHQSARINRPNNRHQEYAQNLETTHTRNETHTSVNGDSKSISEQSQTRQFTEKKDIQNNATNVDAPHSSTSLKFADAPIYSAEDLKGQFVIRRAMLDESMTFFSVSKVIGPGYVKSNKGVRVNHVVSIPHAEFLVDNNLVVEENHRWYPVLGGYILIKMHLALVRDIAAGLRLQLNVFTTFGKTLRSIERMQKVIDAITGRDYFVLEDYMHVVAVQMEGDVEFEAQCFGNGEQLRWTGIDGAPLPGKKESFMLPNETYIHLDGIDVCVMGDMETAEENKKLTKADEVATARRVKASESGQYHTTRRVAADAQRLRDKTAALALARKEKARLDKDRGIATSHSEALAPSTPSFSSGLDQSTVVAATPQNDLSDFTEVVRKHIQPANGPARAAVEQEADRRLAEHEEAATCAQGTATATSGRRSRRPGGKSGTRGTRGTYVDEDTPQFSTADDPGYDY